ncbi:XVIPCD domain-containing protein [Dyella sp.]|uniref:XVIPCD domain-containing protein n=1 Tax=Dyella sp. TaxID=1869338 RepID=UPI002ED67769
MSQMTATDYARLAQNAYQDPQLNQVIDLGGVKYQAIDSANNPLSGYQATAYKRMDDGEIIIAHRGTEFDREPIQDGLIADAGMVLTGVNAQASDAMKFTQKVLDEAKKESQNAGQPVEVTVTGHSLGGTLAEMTAARYGLHGQTFNAYGAAGLLTNVPQGGNQIIDNVAATDLVSAASAHFGEVRTYATEADIQRLNKAGYNNDTGALSLRNPISGSSLQAHAIGNFIPDGQSPGIMTQENADRYEQNKQAVDRYRDDVKDVRTVLSAGWEIPKAIYNGVEKIEHEAAEKLTQTYHALHDLAKEEIQKVKHGLEEVGHKISDGWHKLEHAFENIGHKVVEGAEKLKDNVEDKLKNAGKEVVEGAEKLKENVENKLKETGESLKNAGKAVVAEAKDIAQHPEKLINGRTLTLAAGVALGPEAAVITQALTHVSALDKQFNRPEDQTTHNIAAAVGVKAIKDGLERIDHVHLSDDRSQIFAVQGELNSPLKRISQMSTAVAANTPVEQSGQALQQLQRDLQVVQKDIQALQNNQQQAQAKPQAAPGGM